MTKTPATVVTGFLGAGKTTLLRHLIANAAGRRLALIINEFGDLGIDRDLLLGCGDATCGEGDVIELANGCICCTVADAFQPTMTALLDRPEPPDHILIETSGVALPKPLIKAFDWPDIRARATVDSVIAVIDGPALVAGAFDETLPASAPPDAPHDFPLAELFADHLGCADLVILNKADMLDTAVDAARARLAARIRPGTRVLAATRGALDIGLLLGVGAGAEDDLASRPSIHDDLGEHDHDDFRTFIVEIGTVPTAAALIERVDRAVQAHDIYRIKGFVEIAGKPMRHVVQAVGPRIEPYYDRPWRPDEPRVSRLVVIGASGIDRDAVAAILAG